MTIQIFIENEPDAKAVEALSDGLDQYNQQKIGPDPSQPLWVFSRTHDGEIVGGLRGVVLWTWFLVDWLWVVDKHRGQGLGTKLLTAGEQAARDKGCKSAFLNTFSFQAPEFYQKNGYKEFGRLENFPGDQIRFWMCKKHI